MFKLLFLLAFLALSSLQFQSNSLDIDWTNEEQEWAAEEYLNEECEWIYEESGLNEELNEEEAWTVIPGTAGKAVVTEDVDVTVTTIDNIPNALGNTDDEIADAVKNATSQIGDAFRSRTDDIGSIVAANVSASLQQTTDLGQTASDALGAQIGQIVSESLENLNNHAKDVHNTIANVVKDSVNAFREARNNAQDSGAAVGDVVGDVLRDLNNTAGDVEHAVETSITDAVSSADDLPDRIEFIANDVANRIGKAVASLLLAASAHTDDVQNIVANAINDGVQESGAGHTAEEIGNSVSNVAVSIRDNADAVGDAIGQGASDAFATIEGIPQDQVNGIRDRVKDEVIKAIEDPDLSADQIDQQISNAINNAATEGNNATVNVAEVINNIGQQIANNIAAGNL